MGLKFWQRQLRIKAMHITVIKTREVSINMDYLSPTLEKMSLNGTSKTTLLKLTQPYLLGLRKSSMNPQVPLKRLIL